LRKTGIVVTASPDGRIREALDDAMADLGLVAQSIVDATGLPDERVRAVAYIQVVTQVVERASAMMVELNRAGVAKIMREFGIENREIFPEKPKFIV